jgi:hypothetical protein
MRKPKIFIGPMSKNIVDSVIEYANDNDYYIGLIPSRRQVDHDGGYVNNWTTKEFSEYVKSKTDKVLLVRDHGGPNQGNIEDNGLESLKEDCKYFDVIHVDVWKRYYDLPNGIEKTVELIKYCYNLNPNLLFEIGTEQSIRPFGYSDLDYLLQEVKLRLPYNVISQIKYVVIQSGTALEGNSNIGEYDKQKLIRMVNVVNKHGLISKEHNGDYLPEDLVHEKFNLGLDSINIAPEFGQLETNVILNKMKDVAPELIEEFYQICYASNRWVKWVSDDFKPEENKEEIINISGHYVFSNPDFIKLKERLYIDDNYIRLVIKEKLKKLV